MTWLANAALFYGLWAIGKKKRIGFLFQFVGEVLWLLAGLAEYRADISVLCGVFATLALLNYFRWVRAES